MAPSSLYVNAMYLLEKGWQIKLSWLRLILQALQAMHRAIGRVCQEVLLKGIREAVVPAGRCNSLRRCPTLRM